MTSLNCWEYMACGRQPGGTQAAALGVCQAATLSLADGVNGGVNGGRVCWAVSGTIGGGSGQCQHLEKVSDCCRCDFLRFVRHVQGGDMVLVPGCLAVALPEIDN